VGVVIEDTERFYQLRDQTCLCRQGISWSPRGQSTPRLHLRPKRGVFGVIKRELRCRCATEAVIGHMKTDDHLARCHLKGREGDAANVILTPVGHNLRFVLAWLRPLCRLIVLAFLQAFATRSALRSAS
jgi:hypothetical protein